MLKWSILPPRQARSGPEFRTALALPTRLVWQKAAFLPHKTGESGVEGLQFSPVHLQKA